MPGTPEQIRAAMEGLTPEQQRQFVSELERRRAARPMQGFEAALSGSETIGEAPWYTRNVGGLPSVTQALASLPGLGGLLGGILGGPSGPLTAAGGAALGGAGGEAISQLGFRAIGGKAPETSTEAATGIGQEAAKQAVYELLGRGMAGGVKALGKGMVEQSVRPTITLQGEFPNVMETIIKERIPVGAAPFGTRKGSEKATARLIEESKAVKDILAKAGARGKTFDPNTMTQAQLKELADAIAKTEAQNPGGSAALKKLMENFSELQPGPMTPLQVQELKQAGQKIAKPIYKAVARGENVGTEQNVKAQFNAAIAKGAKESLETIPGVKQGEASKQALIGAQKAIRRAEERRLSLMAESASGVAGTLGALLGPGGDLDDRTRNAVISWGLTRGILHPRQLSRIGLALTADQTSAILKQFPRLADMIFSASQATGDQSTR